MKKIIVIMRKFDFFNGIHGLSIIVYLLIGATAASAQHIETLYIPNTRNIPSMPGDYVRCMKINFKYSSIIGLSNVETYSTVMGLRGWSSDNTGGKAYELAFASGKIFLRSGYTSGWGDWERILTNDIIKESTNGKIGIGVDNPVANLEIDGGSNTQLIIKHSRDVTSNNGSLVLTDGTNSLFLDGNEIQSATNMYINNDNASNLLINNGGGNVGIGTTTPQSKLAVNGTITAQKVKVTQSGWPDYVFDSTYNAPPLSLIKAYIKANHHLPDMPSAKEIESKGLDLGEMQKIQMQKVEEIMLYLIKMNKKQIILEKRVKELESLNQGLVKQIQQLKSTEK